MSELRFKTERNKENVVVQPSVYGSGGVYLRLDDADSPYRGPDDRLTQIHTHLSRDEAVELAETILAYAGPKEEDQAPEQYTYEISLGSERLIVEEALGPDKSVFVSLNDATRGVSACLDEDDVDNLIGALEEARDSHDRHYSPSNDDDWDW